MVTHSSRGLMLVEDPEDTLKALCQLKSFIDRESFRHSYERITKRVRDPVDEKTIDTHFYSLTIFGFLEKTDSKGIYEISSDGRKICKLLNDKKKKKDFQKFLATILKENPSKGKLFKKFLKFVVLPKTKDAIYEKFGNIPGRTLISWCTLADLVVVKNNDVWYKKEDRKSITLEEFRQNMTIGYNKLRKTAIFGIQRPYVSIRDLRKYVCAKTGILPEDFDSFFRRVLGDQTDGKIRLYGAPSSAFIEEDFEYNKRLWANMSIEV